MLLKGERSKAETTSLPQMFQMEFISCMNFTISSSDLQPKPHISEWLKKGGYRWFGRGQPEQDATLTGADSLFLRAVFVEFVI